MLWVRTRFTSTLRFLILLALGFPLAGLTHAQEMEPPPPPPETSEAPSIPDVFEGRAGTFEFVAADQASMQIAKRIGRMVLEVCDEILTPPLERIPRISVKLAPEGRGNLEGEIYRLYPDIAGDYGLAVSWTPQLSVSQFSQALVECYLRQIVYTLSDRMRAEEVPPWLIAGADLRVQVALRPSLVEYLRELGRNSEMVSLEDLFSKKKLADLTSADRIASYWFTELIFRSLGNEKQVRNFFDTVVEGNPPIEVLQRKAEARGGFSNGIEAWWVIGFQDLVHRETGIVLSIERTGKQLFLLNRFELVENGQAVFTGAGGLWEFRDNQLIRQSLTARLTEIEAVLPRANPIFYNAFRSLGLQFQSLLDKDKEAYEKHSAEFDEEIRISSALAQDVQTLAADPEAKLPDVAPEPVFNEEAEPAPTETPADPGPELP